MSEGDKTIHCGDEGEIHYRPRGRISGLRAGAHPSRAVGALGGFRDQVPFMAHPDARRIDVRATLQDPFENVIVRRHRQRASIDLYALVDLTGSLRYEGNASKAELAASLCVSLARSATRIGDRFGLIGCGASLREECFIPATARRGIADEVRARLGRAAWQGSGADGLLAAAPRLAGRRKTVFLISDFLLPARLLDALFDSLTGHDLVPVIIGDSTEDLDLPDWGVMELADLETGGRRLVFMRPALKRRWIAAAAERRAELGRLAARYGRAPVTIRDSFDAERFSRDLLEA
jgi:uncharacterized protein (DUF58 family)